MSVFDLPMTARPGKDTIAGQDELGRTVYKTVTGERYTMPERTEMPAPTMGQRFENLGGLASRAYENLSVQGAIDAAKGIGEGIVSGIVQGFTAPGRALSGEPVSLGDVLATAGMAQVGAAPMRAPAGSLRSGAMGGGRPPVTFDDVARAMDEGAPAPSPSFTVYQGSPHNFAAERLVRMPDGSTQYIVGAPDVLPDVPTGAEVLQDFPLGRQRTDKIGTGEGAQAYGYGLYGAEAEDVAKKYRDQLSGGNTSAARRTLESAGGEIDKAILETEDKLRRLDERAAAGDFGGDKRRFDAQRQIQIDKIDQLKRFRDTGSFDPGSMYEMQVNADPEAFLDWDKPLSEQPQVAQRLGYSTMSADAINEEAMRIFEAMPGGAWMKDPVAKARIDELQEMLDRTVPDQTGAEYYRGGSEGDVSNLLSQMGYGNPQEASAALREAGIPGIKYLDAGSRGADAGSRNFVIFDENLISIVRKYGIAGAAAMLGVSAIDVEQALADNLPQDQWESLVVGK